MPRTPRSSRPASGSSRRPTRAATTRAPTCGPTSSTTPGAAARGDPFFQPDGPGLGRVGHLPRLLERQRRARPAGPRARPATSPRATPPARSTSTGTIAAFSSRGPSPSAGSSSRISPRRASTSAPRRTAATRLRVLSGTSMASPHVAGTVALIWSIVSGAQRRHRRTGSAPGPDCDRRRRTDLRRDCGRQQRLGRGQARRARRRDRCAERPDRNACWNGRARRQHGADRRRRGARDRAGQPRSRHRTRGAVLDAPARRDLHGHRHRARLRASDRLERRSHRERDDDRGTSI